MSSSVLVLGSDTRSFLAVIRSLGRAGLQVHTAWSPLDSASLTSKYVRKIHNLPAYIPGERHWLDALKELCRRESFRLVIPCDDPSLIPLQTHRDELEQAAPETTYYLLSDEAYRITSDKAATYSLAESLGISRPRQTHVFNRADLLSAAQEFGYPLIVKPRASYTAGEPSSKKHVLTIFRKEKLDLAVPHAESSAGALVQQFFSGVGAGVEVLSFEGRVLTAFQHQRVHEPLSGGGSSYRKSVPLHPELMAAAEQLMQAMRYTGVCMVEFRQDLKSGKWILVEMNGRFWGSLPLAIAAGIDFPRYLYEMLCEGRREFPRTYKLNIHCRNWLIDAAWMRHNLRSQRSVEVNNTVPIGSVLGEARHFLLGRERSDTFVLDDPAPAVRELKTLASGVLRQLRQRAGASAQSQKESLAALRRAKRILVLCKGNICRSPFLERCLRRQLGDEVEIHSAGFHPPFRRSPQTAIAAAKAFGIDLESHRSAAVTAEAVSQADAIVIFDPQNLTALTSVFPVPSSKIIFAGVLDGGSPYVDDPFGGSAETFARTYARLARLAECAGTGMGNAAPELVSSKSGTLL